MVLNLVVLLTSLASVLQRLPSFTCKRTDVQWSQIRLNGSEPIVHGSSWRSFQLPSNYEKFPQNLTHLKHGKVQGRSMQNDGARQIHMVTSACSISNVIYRPKFLPVRYCNQSCPPVSTLALLDVLNFVLLLKFCFCTMIDSSLLMCENIIY